MKTVANTSPPDGTQSELPDIPPPLVDHPRYRIIGRLGEGGMGVVYKAEHRVMGRTVALKVLSAGITTANTAAVDRFRREVRLASRLSHQNIVTAFDADEAGGLHFLVMECVEGMSLDKLLRERGPLPVGLACGFVYQAAIGLQHAHEKGMIHRDIKPHNMMVTPSGQVKILDFGLACVAAGDGIDPSSLTAMAITKPQTLMGTPDFLSPEQARSAAVDIRSDLYSLGCTLYYLLTGKPPFEAVGTYAKMIAHFQEPIPELSASRHDIPAAVARIQRKLMAKSPDDRFQTPNEVAAALQPFAEIGEVGALSGAINLTETSESVRTEKSHGLALVATEASISALPMATEFGESRTEIHPASHGHLANQPPRTQGGLGRLIPGLLLVGVVAVVAAGVVNQLNKPNDPQANQTDPSEPPANKIDPGQPIPAPKPVVPNRKKQVLLLLPNEFANGEFVLVSDTFRKRDVGVLTAGAEKKPLKAYRYGMSLDKPTFVASHDPTYGLKDIDDAVLDSVDAVIVMPREILTFATTSPAAPEVQRVLGKAIEKKKVIAAIGSAVVVLASYGVLENRDASSVPNRPKALDPKKAKWRDDPKVVVDLPFITSGEFSHSKEVADEIMKAFP